MMKPSALTLLMMIWAAAGSAQDLVDTPDGCKAIATVYKTSCHATTIFDCSAFKESHTYEDGSLRVIHVYTSEWELVEFRFAENDGARMTAVPDTGSNTNLDQLLKTGTSQEDGQFLMNTGMIKDRAYTLSGRIEMDGDQQELGGAAFKTGRMYRTFALQPGGSGMEFEIDIYASIEPDLFIEGDWTRSIAGSNREEFDQTPYSVSWPDDVGFLAIRPEQGCE